MKKKPICNTAGEKIAPEGNIRRRSRAFQPTPQAVCRLVLRRTTGKVKFVTAKIRLVVTLKYRGVSVVTYRLLSPWGRPT